LLIKLPVSETEGDVPGFLALDRAFPKPRLRNDISHPCAGRAPAERRHQARHL